VRVDAINDEFIERSFELEVRYLSLLKVQSQSWNLARDARSSQHGSLGWRFMVIECLTLCFRCDAQRHLTRGAASPGMLETQATRERSEGSGWAKMER
jgi:hypothetical protein